MSDDDEGESGGDFGSICGSVSEFSIFGGNTGGSCFVLSNLSSTSIFDRR